MLLTNVIKSASGYPKHSLLKSNTDCFFIFRFTVPDLLISSTNSSTVVHSLISNLLVNCFNPALPTLEKYFPLT
ncbi:CMP138.5bL [Camelpox virus CMS]|uniref:CMP138.5bL n=1 Tax=Camelpox virus (strain CMS) TaxID=203172 RepID=Q8QQ32_CAMPS|nr:CMP138.5bL [Camelpox virus CMS]